MGTFTVWTFLKVIGMLVFVNSSQSSADEMWDMSLQEIMMMEITTGSKSGIAREDIPAVVTVFTREDIQRFGARHLEDLVNLIPGFTSGRTNQITASAMNLAVRGSTTFFAENVLVLRDGQRVNDPSSGGGFTFLQRILLEDIEQVEVIRGPGSALYGANAFVGVINLITSGKDIEKETVVSVQLGNLEGEEAALRFSRPVGEHAGFSLTAQYQHYFDDFTPLPDVNQVIIPGVLEIPYLDRFSRDEAEVLDVSARFAYKDLVLSAQIQRLNMDNAAGVGLPRSGVFTDVLGVDHENADGRQFDLDSDVDVLTAGLVYDTALGEKTNFHTALTYTNYEAVSEFGSPIQFAHILASPIVLDAVDQVGGFIVPTETETLNIDAYIDRSFGENQSLIFGVNFQHDEGREDTTASAVPSGQYPGLSDIKIDPPIVFEAIPASEREITALYAQYSVNLNEKTTITGGLRYDDYDDVGSTTNPRLAMVYKPVENTTLKLLYGTAFRAPNFQEAKRELPTFYITNPDIAPEENETFEFQAMYTTKSGLALSANFYHYTTDNVIRLTSTNNPDLPFEQVFINSGEREADGFEAELLWQGSGGVSLFANSAVVLNSEETNLGTTTDVQGIPKLSLNMGLSWRPVFDWLFSASIYHRADFETVTHPNFAPLELEDFTIADINVEWTFRPELSATLLLHNILDETKVMTESRTFQPSGVPHDERQILVGLRWQPD
ncbi:MAG: TonB-dependent receptor [Acidobacteriota bacterium]|nr:TonB-dependent receptor [Acidobacteriota bacterium]